MTKKKNELEFENENVKAYVQQIQAVNGILAQQLDQLKEELAISIQENEEGREINAELRAENKELKEKCKKYGEINEQETKDYADLEAENEKLNKSFEDIAKAIMEICNQCSERDDYNIPCKQIRDLDYSLQLEIEENEKLKQTLDEIKEIAEHFTQKGLEPQSVEHQLKLRGKEELARIILQKISEVDDESYLDNHWLYKN